MINLIRDPRWGRADEAPTEDPLLAGEFGAGVTKGIQQIDAAGCLLATAEAKHFAAYARPSRNMSVDGFRP